VQDASALEAARSLANSLHRIGSRGVEIVVDVLDRERDAGEHGRSVARAGGGLPRAREFLDRPFPA
jgi:hypothetical protein